jgi:hypothetical protein
MLCGPLRGSDRYPQRPRSRRHLPVERDEISAGAARHGNMDPIRRLQRKIKPTQISRHLNEIVVINFDAQRRPGGPCIEVGKHRASLNLRKRARPHASCDNGRKLRNSKIADKQITRAGLDKCLGAFAERLGHQKVNNHARVEIQVQRQSSSRICRINVTASVSAGVSRARRALSHSKSASVIRRGCRFTDLSSTTGSPWRVITTPSPSRARLINSDNLFFASATV